mgnify:CR=1 FL=1
MQLYFNNKNIETKGPEKKIDYLLINHKFHDEFSYTKDVVDRSKNSKLKPTKSSLLSKKSVSNVSSISKQTPVLNPAKPKPVTKTKSTLVKSGKMRNKSNVGGKITYKKPF